MFPNIRDLDKDEKHICFNCQAEGYLWTGGGTFDYEMWIEKDNTIHYALFCGNCLETHSSFKF